MIPRFMIPRLRLAEYDLETGKFKRFLQIGSHDYTHPKDDNAETYFGYYHYFIRTETHKDPGYIDEKDFKNDEKDPLDRFDGLFDGRTYGEGRFVLMKERDFVKQVERVCEGDHFITYEMGNPIFSGRKNHIEILQGNLHENPELFDKIKLS